MRGGGPYMVNARLGSQAFRGGRPRGNRQPDPFAALADSTRRRLLIELSTSDRTVSELASDLQISQPTVSQHLKVLRETGLVVYCSVGRSHHYRLCARVLYEVRDWLMQLERSLLDAGGTGQSRLRPGVRAAEPNELQALRHGGRGAGHMNGAANERLDRVDMAKAEAEERTGVC